MRYYQDGASMSTEDDSAVHDPIGDMVNTHRFHLRRSGGSLTRRSGSPFYRIARAVVAYSVQVRLR